VVHYSLPLPLPPFFLPAWHVAPPPCSRWFVPWALPSPLGPTSLSAHYRTATFTLPLPIPHLPHLPCFHCATPHYTPPYGTSTHYPRQFPCHTLGSTLPGSHTTFHAHTLPLQAHPGGQTLPSTCHTAHALPTTIPPPRLPVPPCPEHVQPHHYPPAHYLPLPGALRQARLPSCHQLRHLLPHARQQPARTGCPSLGLGSWSATGRLGLYGPSVCGQTPMPTGLSFPTCATTPVVPGSLVGLHCTTFLKMTAHALLPHHHTAACLVVTLPVPPCLPTYRLPACLPALHWLPCAASIPARTSRRFSRAHHHTPTLTLQH